VNVRALAAIAAVASLGLAACGGDDDAAGGATSSTTGATATTELSSSYEDGSATTTAVAPTDTTESGSATTDAGAATTGELVPGDPATGKPEVQLPATIPTELVVTDLVEGDGDTVEAGDTVSVDYVGVLTADGTEFDNSYDFGQPLTFVAGSGQLIPGFDQGVIGARVGGRRQLDIPADLAYGSQGAGDVIPPDSAITFVVDVVDTQKPPPVPTVGPMADPSECPAPDGSSDQQQEFDAYPPMCIDVTDSYTAVITTNHGEMTVELDAEKAPLTVNNFVTLARYHYFDDTVCHRAIPQFVVQCGDPTASGTGGPGYTIPDELPAAGEYQVGSLAMANTGSPNTGGSQFFVITGPNGEGLPPQYSLFGQVTDGLDVLAELDKLGNPESNGVPPLEEIRIISVEITSGA
jgi:cyclophilin family peptidyl-prolyl cis-trans isomerase/FKBP-type peptidyl-prolyl cis-trans isomerase